MTEIPDDHKMLFRQAPHRQIHKADLNQTAAHPLTPVVWHAPAETYAFLPDYTVFTGLSARVNGAPHRCTLGYSQQFGRTIDKGATGPRQTKQFLNLLNL